MTEVNPTETTNHRKSLLIQIVLPAIFSQWEAARIARPWAQNGWERVTQFTVVGEAFKSNSETYEFTAALENQNKRQKWTQTFSKVKWESKRCAQLQNKKDGFRGQCCSSAREASRSTSGNVSLLPCGTWKHLKLNFEEFGRLPLLNGSHSYQTKCLKVEQQHRSTRDQQETM